MALVKYDLTIFSSINNYSEHLAVRDKCTSWYKIAQTKIEILRLAFTVSNGKLSIKVVEVGVWRFAWNLNFNLTSKVVFDLCLSFLNWHFRFQISFTVKLSSLNVPIILTIFICYLKYYAVCGNLLLVLKHQNIANFYIFQLRLNDMTWTFSIKCTDFHNWCCICFLVWLVARVVGNTFFDYSDSDDDAKDDSHDNGWVNRNLFKCV